MKYPFRLSFTLLMCALLALPPLGLAQESAALTREKASSLLPYAKLSQAVYTVEKNVDEWTLILDFPDRASGFHGAVYRNKGKAAIVYEGTSDISPRDILTDIGQLSPKDYPPAQYREALLFAHWTGKALEGQVDDVVFTGHSLGGGLAAYAALMTGGRAYTFNPAGLRSAMADVRKGNIEAATKADLTHIVVEGDVDEWATALVRVLTNPTAKDIQVRDVVSAVGELPGKVYKLKVDGVKNPIEAHSIETVLRGLAVEYGNKAAKATETPAASQAEQPFPIQGAPQPKYTDPSTGMEFLWIEGGCTVLGDTSGTGSPDEQPAREVCVAGFYLASHEATQAQWEKVMAKNPSFWKGEALPVEQVSFLDAQEFAAKLSSMSGKAFRLPSEAEWEFAARGGAKGTGNDFPGSAKLDTVAWYSANSEGHTHPCAEKTPNELGLYDLSGNVWEWVTDWYGATYYRSRPKDNPTGPGMGANHVIRGGSWYRDAEYAKVSYRDDRSQEYRSNDLGFRLVMAK